MKKFLMTILYTTALIFVLVPEPLMANNTDDGASEVTLSKGEVAQILAPIALYPDSLLTHILIGSTYPIEIIEAHRWKESHSDVIGEEIAEQVEDFEWDPSIVALISFPHVLEKMSTELSWTQQLGDAFLQNEAQVLATIQNLRGEADKAGNLAKMENVKVIKEQKTIIIEPAQQDVIYVPYYDTRVVYGGWHWAHYPPVYWHYPRSRHVVLHRSPFYWHTGVHISFNYFFSAFHWHNHHVVISHHNRHHHRRYYQSRRHIVHGGYAKRWHHKPVHRRGVAYKSRVLTSRYKSHRPSRHQTKLIRSSEKKRMVKNKAYRVDKHKSRHHQLNTKVKKTNNKFVATRKNHAKHSADKSALKVKKSTNTRVYQANAKQRQARQSNKQASHYQAKRTETHYKQERKAKQYKVNSVNKHYSRNKTRTYASARVHHKHGGKNSSRSNRK